MVPWWSDCVHGKSTFHICELPDLIHSGLSINAFSVYIGTECVASTREPHITIVSGSIGA
uniref:Uncharacterized protein n=1 Tax=Onchocerca volvulus TaxID=6282 RepID=A0A8R1TLK0_ONCVO